MVIAMSMDIRKVIFGAAVSSVLICVASVQAVPLTDKMLNDWVVFDSDIRKVQVRGYAKVNFGRSKDNKNRLTLVGRCNERCQVERWQRGDTLYLWSNSYCSDSYWQVEIPYIQKIRVGNHAYAHAKDLQTKIPLSLKIDDQGRVDLRGKLMIDKVRHYSLGGVRLIGIDSPVLELVSSGSGWVVAQGKVDALTVRLNSHAVVDAGRLQVRTLYADLKDWAKLWARVRHTLFARADGDSRLYYRPYPKRKVIELRERALVGFQTRGCTPSNFANCAKSEIK